MNEKFLLNLIFRISMVATAYIWQITFVNGLIGKNYSIDFGWLGYIPALPILFIPLFCILTREASEDRELSFTANIFSTAFDGMFKIMIFNGVVGAIVGFAWIPIRIFSLIGNFL